MLYRFFILNLVFFAGLLSQAQTLSSNQKLLAEVSILEAKGDYRGALFYIKKLEQNTTLTTGEEIAVLYHAAFNAEQLDQFEQATTYAQQADKLLAASTLTPQELSIIYLPYIQWKETRGLLKQALSQITKWEADKDKLSPFDWFQVQWCKSSVQRNLAYYKDLVPSIDKNIQSLSASFVNDTHYQSDGTLNTVSLSAFHQVSRQLLWGEYILLKADLLIENGEYEQALSWIDANAKQATAILGNREGFKAKLLYRKASANFHIKEYVVSENISKQALALAQQFFMIHAPELIAIEKTVVHSLVMQGKVEEANYYQNDLDVKLYSNYSKKEAGYLPVYYRKIQQALQVYDIPTADKWWKEVQLSDKIPAYHPIRIQWLQMAYQMDLKKYKWKEAEQKLQLLTQQYDSLYSKEHPNYTLLELQKANFYQYYNTVNNTVEKSYTDIFKSNQFLQWGIARPEVIEAITHATQGLATLNKTDKALAVVQLEKERVSASPLLQSYYACLAITVNAQIGEFIVAEKEMDKLNNLWSSWNTAHYPLLYKEMTHSIVYYYTQKGDYAKANIYVEKWNAFKKEFESKHKDTLNTDERIAYLYIKESKFALSDKILQSELKQITKEYGATSILRVSILNKLAEQSIYLGNYSNADTYLNEAANLLKENNALETQEYAINQLVYAKLYQEIGDYEKAEQCIERAYEYYKQKYQGSKSGVLLNQYALLAYEADYFSRKNDLHSTTKLDKWFVQSFDIIQQKATAESGIYAEGLENQIVYLILSKRYKEAIEKINKAKEIWDAVAGTNSLHHAQLDYLQGKVLELTGKYKEALTYYESSRQLYKSIFDENHPGYTRALGSVAQMHYVLGDIGKTVEEITLCTNKSLVYIQKVFPYLSEREKNSYWNKTKPFIEFLNTVAFTNADKYPQLVEQAVNIQLQTKAILLNSLIKIKNKILSTGDSTAIQLYQQWQDTRDDLTLAYSLPVTERKTNNLDIAALEENLEKLEKSLSTYSDEFSKNKSKHALYQYQWKEIKKILKENEIALEVIPFRFYSKGFTDSIYYVVVSIHQHSSKPEFVVMKKGLEMQTKYIKYYRNVIKFDVDDKHLNEFFWKDIETLIKPQHNTIYFAGDGVYTQLNLETLKDKDGKLLLLSKNIVNIGSCRDLLTNTTRSSSSGKNMVLVGNPTYYTHAPEESRTIPALVGTEMEVKSIDKYMVSQKWKTQVFLNSSATEDTVKKVSNPTVLHISTHGFFWNQSDYSNSDLVESGSVNPLLTSGLILYNGGELMNMNNIYTINSEEGVLTAYEAMNLSLDKTEIVILSACETGLGEVQIGEGVFGLQRAFTVAGSRCIVMSLFKVSDEVTTILMERFYENWIKTGDKHQAFLQAKLDIMKTYPSAKYWGAFVMTGLE
ncbi:MAG: CHAT domain-containing tetratricopeptide repeat protein [Cytophagaceae bacterium]